MVWPWREGFIIGLITLCSFSATKIKFLPKRSDFIYDYDKHIAIEIYTPRSKMNNKQSKFLEEIINKTNDD